MKKNKLTFQVDDRISITMHKPKTGVFPIGRAENGMICKIKTDNKKAYFEYGSAWRVTVVEVGEKFLVVEPDYCERTAEQERAEVANKVKAAFQQHKPQRREKIKPRYQYMSANDSRRNSSGNENTSEE